MQKTTRVCNIKGSRTEQKFQDQIESELEAIFMYSCRCCCLYLCCCYWCCWCCCYCCCNCCCWCRCCCCCCCLCCVRSEMLDAEGERKILEMPSSERIHLYAFVRSLSSLLLDFKFWPGPMLWNLFCNVQSSRLFTQQWWDMFEISHPRLRFEPGGAPTSALILVLNY